jgi:hypothetical protein
MNENEKELIRIIRESEDPAKAMVMAIQITTDFLAEHGIKEAERCAVLWRTYKP